MTKALCPGCADALLFDLGRVVLDTDFERTLRRWAHHAGRSPEALMAHFPPDEAYKRHERGEISDSEFFAVLRDTLGIDITDEHFLEGWNAIFDGEMKGISELLARAGKRLPLYAFSNTNAAHVAHFSEHFADVLSHFEEVFASSRIGLRKPDPAAFGHVVAAIGRPAARILFFDDLLENVEAARSCGLLAVHVRSIDDVAGALTALGI